MDEPIRKQSLVYKIDQLTEKNEYLEYRLDEAKNILGDCSMILHDLILLPWHNISLERIRQIRNEIDTFLKEE